jgi:hypothetical protein
LHSAPSTNAGGPRNDNKNGYDQNQKKNGNKPLMINKFTPRNKTGGGQDGHPAGGRKWVMPVGAAFFQGTNAVSSSAGAAAAAGSSAAATKTAGASSGGTAIVAGSSIGRILRPNERIEQVHTDLALIIRPRLQRF